MGKSRLPQPPLVWEKAPWPGFSSQVFCWNIFFFFKACLRTELWRGPHSNRKSGAQRRPFLAYMIPAAEADTLSCAGNRPTPTPGNSRARTVAAPHPAPGTAPSLRHESPAPACRHKSLSSPSPPTSRHTSPPRWPQGVLMGCSLHSATLMLLPGERAGAGSCRQLQQVVDSTAWHPRGKNFLFKHQLPRQTWLPCQACGSTHFLTLPASSWQLHLALGSLLPSRTCSPAEHIGSFCYLRARPPGHPSGSSWNYRPESRLRLGLRVTATPPSPTYSPGPTDPQTVKPVSCPIPRTRTLPPRELLAVGTGIRPIL